MPSIQKIVLSLAFVATAFAAQISDGQIQQPTSVVTPVAVVKQITDGQLQQATSTPKPTTTVLPPVKQITDGQIQQVSASAVPSPSSNGTTVTTPSPSAFTGAASLMGYSQEAVVLALGAAAAFAVL